MLKVFLSYAKEDRDRVLPYFDRLTALGYLPWMDVKSLLPGQNWELEIDKAFNASHVILAFLSKNSVSKRGFVQRETAQAVENLRYKREDDIYLIACRLEDCEVPQRFASRQYTDLFAEGGWDLVAKSLGLAATQQNIQIEQGVSYGLFRIFTRTVTENFEGYPGYEVNIAYPEFSHPERKEACAELNAVVRGEAFADLHAERAARFTQNPDQWKDSLSTRQGSRGRDFNVATLTEAVLSIQFVESIYGAGAAHPNYWFRSWNCWLDPVARISLSDFFVANSHYETRIAAVTRDLLRKEMWNRSGGEELSEDEWFKNGTEAHKGNYDVFTFDTEGITFYFAPYHLTGYAWGSWVVTVPYFDLRDLLADCGPHKTLIERGK